MPGRHVIDAIKKASQAIDPFFLNSPQFVSEPLSALAGFRVVTKLETANPIRCFKGRGADWWMATKGKRLGKAVAASAGNFGMALAYAGRTHGVDVTIFVAETANPAKVEAIRNFGAEIRIMGRDFDAAKDAARNFAKAEGSPFVEDGREEEITVGAGTIGLELARFSEPIDAVFIPVGNGALINGVGAALKAASASTTIIAVAAAGAPSMHNSWKAGRAIATDRADTIADGVAVRIPVVEALGPLAAVTDDFVLVTEAEIVAAMRLYFRVENQVAEPAGAVSLAGALSQAEKWRDKTIATILCGSNIDPRRRNEWLCSA